MARRARNPSVFQVGFGQEIVDRSRGDRLKIQSKINNKKSYELWAHIFRNRGQRSYGAARRLIIEEANVHISVRSKEFFSE